MINLTQILKEDVEGSGRRCDFNLQMAVRLEKSVKTIEAKLANTDGQDFSLNQLIEICDTAKSLQIELQTFGGAIVSLLDNQASPGPLTSVFHKTISTIGRVAAIADAIQDKPNKEETMELLHLATDLEALAGTIRKTLETIP